MRKPSANSCPECGSEEVKSHTTYTINAGEEREEYECQDCGAYFSETKGTPVTGLRRPLSFIQMMLDAFNNDLGVNATRDTFHIGKTVSIAGKPAWRV